MLGLALRTPVNDFVAAARAEHLLLIPAGDNVARLLPPLIIGEAEVAEAMRRLTATCARLSAGIAAVREGAAE
jgi:acetylornithine/N-succinyldiaminopimelate aminotransferase